MTTSNRPCSHPAVARAQGSARGSAARAVLYRMVSPEHVCPFGLKARDLLERRGYVVEDHLLRDHDEAKAFMAQHGVDTTPQVFIGGDRVGGYDALRDFFGLAPAQPAGVSYAPIAAVFGVTALAAAALTWRLEPVSPAGSWLHLFVALSMAVLAILKLRDLEAFTNQFLGYDLLAQKVVRYAYVYPFAEAFAALGMLGGLLLPAAGAAALFIGSVGAVSVVKAAVYVDRRELRCACVGGNSQVPLGAVSLTENLMMVFMGGWTLMQLL